ncbi:protein of unknown function [Nocardioides alpinus]|uniref:DUF4386 domain-containing protein n=1 Tax=Nocardioides alpinus TaxID=748909 RepID=A0A1I0VDT9_9ACTN|nr:DUF4386 domain-containing protein [Nocardioides alpinus]PKH37187.1 DUF4386 domain-containing protein [Nocardioides alpinus]SFA73756.1 protein of unknown function [Nocardioides alpinus]
MSATRTATASTTTARPDAPWATRRTAGVTGALYLALAVAGGIGFLVVRPMLADADAAVTLAHLREHETLARVGLALEMALVVFQALAALWFFRLFHAVDDFAAAAIAVFGVLNSVAVLASAACLATALEAALGGAGGDPGTPQLMYELSENFWGVGNLFFGLWLVPMGICVLRSGTMPRLLGRVLVVGGAGYVLSGFVAYLWPDLALVPDLLVAPATVGELWMVGYLLVRGTGTRS